MLAMDVVVAVVATLYGQFVMFIEASGYIASRLATSSQALRPQTPRQPLGYTHAKT